MSNTVELRLANSSCGSTPQTFQLQLLCATNIPLNANVWVKCQSSDHECCPRQSCATCHAKVIVSARTHVPNKFGSSLSTYFNTNCGSTMAATQTDLSTQVMHARAKPFTGCFMYIPVTASSLCIHLTVNIELRQQMRCLAVRVLPFASRFESCWLD